MIDLDFRIKVVGKKEREKLGAPPDMHK